MIRVRSVANLRPWRKLDGRLVLMIGRILGGRGGGFNPILRTLRRPQKVSLHMWHGCIAGNFTVSGGIVLKGPIVGQDPKACGEIECPP